MDNNIHQLAARLEKKLISYRRDFHQYPESGWTEFRTSARIEAVLRELGYSIRLGSAVIKQSSMMGVPSPEELKEHQERAIREGANPETVRLMEGGLTGVVADLDCGEGPTIALRFDIDANDMSEAEDPKHRPYREKFHSVHPGVMHACGHDGHAAIGLGVAEILAQLKENLSGTVRFIFQPAEEGVRGASPMVDAGILEGVDYILGGHIGYLAREKGKLVCGTEKFLATTKFDVRFTGTPAHAGGAPEEGCNALLAASCAALNLHAITRHSKGASRITVGRIEAGQGRNVIPPNGLIKVETRGETSDVNDFMFEKAKMVIDGAAAMYGVQADITLMGGTKSGASSPSMIDRVAEVGSEIDYFQDDKIVTLMSMGGSEDFSQMMTVVQEQGGEGTYFALGTQLAAGHHDFYFDFDESCLVPGVELVVAMTKRLLS